MAQKSLPKAKQLKVWQGTPEIADRVVAAVSRIATVLRSQRWQMAAAEGLNPTQADVLDLLESRRNGVRLSLVAKQLGVTTASASDSVSALVAKGLVNKAPAQDDARALALTLTTAGRALAAKLDGAEKVVRDAIASQSAAIQQTLYQHLLLIISGLQSDERFPEVRACISCKHFAYAVHDDATYPHHCKLVDAALSPALLRFDCPEHEPAESGAAQKAWVRWARTA